MKQWPSFVILKAQLLFILSMCVHSVLGSWYNIVTNKNKRRCTQTCRMGKPLQKICPAQYVLYVNDTFTYLVEVTRNLWYGFITICLFLYIQRLSVKNQVKHKTTAICVWLRKKFLSQICTIYSSTLVARSDVD